MKVERKMAIIVFWIMNVFSSIAIADSSNCRATHFKSIDELISIVIDSGFSEVNLIRSNFQAATLSVYYKDREGQLVQEVFNPRNVEVNKDLWVRVPEFDYDETPASVNLSCGYGNINYKLAYKVGNSALCFLHNPRGSNMHRKGKLEGCLIIPQDISMVLDKVKQKHRNIFE